MSLLDVLSVLIVLSLFAIAMQLRTLNLRMQSITATQPRAGYQGADSVHDSAHPVFSVRQLQLARQRFEAQHRKQLQLEAELYESSEWRSRPKDQAPSALQERMREVGEATIESESAWKEYEWMVEANIAVSTGRQSRGSTLEDFRKLCEQTRGAAILMAAVHNREKVKKVGQLLAGWTARLGGEAGEEEVTIHLPDLANETFNLGEEYRRKYAALSRE